MDVGRRMLNFKLERGKVGKHIVVVDSYWGQMYKRRNRPQGSAAISSFNSAAANVNTESRSNTNQAESESNN